MKEPENPSVEQLVSVATLVRQTEVEKDKVKKQAEKEGLLEANLWRRAMRHYLLSKGVELAETDFMDRKPGNRLPKSEALTTLTVSRAVA